MQLGLNVDPVHGFSLQEIIDTRTQLVRFPFWWQTGFDYKGWCARLQAVGIEPIAVLDRRAMMGPKGYTIATKMSRLLKRLPTVFYWQIGNEPDGTEDSSWHMTRRRFSQYLQAAVKVFSGRYVIAGGLVSGNASWLTGVDTHLVDAIAVHPYAQTPDSVLALLDAYSQWNKPMCITEFGGQDALFNNGHERAVYHTEMMYNMDTHAMVGMACVFCYSDRMVSGFGLVDYDGIAKESYAAFHDAVGHSLPLEAPFTQF